MEILKNPSLSKFKIKDLLFFDDFVQLPVIEKSFQSKESLKHTFSLDKGVLRTTMDKNSPNSLHFDKLIIK
jgi:hypothetical protein